MYNRAINFDTMYFLCFVTMWNLYNLSQKKLSTKVQLSLTVLGVIYVLL